MKHTPNIFLGCLLAMTLSASAQTSAETPPADHPLKQYAEATRSLYEQVSASVVRVRVDQSPESLIPQQMRKDFPQWRENFLRRGMPATTAASPTVISIEPKPHGHPDGPGPQGGPGGPPPGPGPMPGAPESEETRAAERRARIEGMAGDNYALVKRYLEMRLPRVQDPETLAKVRQGLIRAEALRGEQNSELAGLVIDDQGHVLLMMTLLRDAVAESPIKVTTADGREFAATFVGADYMRGFSIVKMTGGSALPPPVEQARTRPQPGELLMCLSVNTGAVGWITTPGPGMSRRGDERFAVFGEDHGAVFLFSVDGRLAAAGTDHYALPIALMKKEIFEVKTKGYVSRRQFGVRHTPIGIDSPLRKIAVLGHKPAIRVDEVFKNSLAEKAGLKKDDIIVTIDGRSITQLPRILQDLSARSGDVSIGIIRDEKEMELTLPLDKPGERPSDKPARKE